MAAVLGHRGHVLVGCQRFAKPALRSGQVAAADIGCVSTPLCRLAIMDLPPLLPAPARPCTLPTAPGVSESAANVVPVILPQGDASIGVAVSPEGYTAGRAGAARGAGRMGAFDYDAEVAYQFGSADAYGLVVGDTGADFDNWGAKLDLGYAFDCAWTPRVFVSGRYYGGEDNRQFGSDDASVNFNRLFSNEIVTGFIDLLNDLSNAWTGRVGVMCAPMPKIRTVFAVSYYEALESFDRPGFLWWTDSSDTDLGWEVTLFNEYHYSEDLVFEFGWRQRGNNSPHVAQALGCEVF